LKDTRFICARDDLIGLRPLQKRLAQLGVSRRCGIAESSVVRGLSSLAFRSVRLSTRFSVLAGASRLGARSSTQPADQSSTPSLATVSEAIGANTAIAGIAALTASSTGGCCAGPDWFWV
jgi:hypothetical protein